VLRVLANKLGLEKAEYQSSEQIRDELKQLFSNDEDFNSNLSSFEHINLDSEVASNDASKMYRVSDTPIYAVDNVVRRASSLQKAVVDQQSHVAMSGLQAKQLDMFDEQIVRVVQGNTELTLPLRIDENISEGCIWVQKSSTQNDSLGEAIAPVEIQRTGHA